MSIPALPTMETWTLVASGALKRKVTLPSVSMRGYWLLPRLPKEGLASVPMGVPAAATGGATTIGGWATGGLEPPPATDPWPAEAEVETVVQLSRTKSAPATLSARMEAWKIVGFMGSP